MDVNLKEKVAIIHLLDAQSRTAATYKTPLVDRTKFKRVFFVINVGVSGDATSWNLVEGDTTADASLTNVGAGDYNGVTSVCSGTSDDQTTAWLEYKGSKKYVGANIVHAGTTLSSCDALCYHAENEPCTTTIGSGTART